MTSRVSANARLLAGEIGYEQKAYWRNPAGATLAVAFPVIFLVILGSLNRHTRIDFLGNVAYDQYFTAGIIAYGIAATCYANLAVSLVARREQGLLKRLFGTPLAPWTLFGGIIGSACVVATLLVLLTTAIGVTTLGVSFPGRWLPLVISLILGATCCAAIALAVSTFVPNIDAAAPVVNVVFMGVAFVSGVFYPLQPGSTLDRIAAFLPIKHLVNATFRSFNPHLHGSAYAGKDFAVLAIWAGIAAVIAARRFTWQPKGSR